MFQNFEKLILQTTNVKISVAKYVWICVLGENRDKIKSDISLNCNFNKK